MRTVLLAALICAPALAQNNVGINAHLPADDELDAIADLGVQWMRIDNNWLQVEPRDGEFEWRHIDRVVNGAEARGVRVMMTLAYAPAWASEGDADGVHSNNVPRAGLYERYVEAVVRRYMDRVTHYGIWNEPNLDHFWEGTREQYLERILRPGAAAVKRACPDCSVVGPDLAGVGSWQSYLEPVLEEAGDVIDVLAHHTYASPQSVRAQWACDDLDHAIDIGADAICFYKPGLKQVMEAAGWAGEVWITETGHRADPWDADREQEKQVDYARHILGMQLATAWWTNTFFYELTDCRPAQPTCEIDGYGVMRRSAGPDDSWADNFVLKPVYRFLRDTAAGPEWGGEPVHPPDPPVEERPRIEAPHREAGMPDGQLGEWDDAGCVLLNDYETLEQPRVGAADLSARACAAWSDDALWLSVEVRDERQDNENPDDTLWNGDSVQLAVDVDADAAEGAGYDDDDLEVSVALARGESRWFTHHGAGDGVTAAVARDGDRTRYELRVPLDGLAAERALRASFLVNDADGAGREGWLEWTAGIGREKAPALFGDVVLVGRDSVPQADAGPPAPDMGRVPPPPPEPLDGGEPPPPDPDDGVPPPDAAPDPDDGVPPIDAGQAGDVDLRGNRSDATTVVDDGGDEGCGCSTGSTGSSWALLMLLGLGRTRRDRA